MVISSTTSLFCGCHGAIPEWRGAGGIPHPQPPTSPGCRGGAIKKFGGRFFPVVVGISVPERKEQGRYMLHIRESTRAMSMSTFPYLTFMEKINQEFREMSFMRGRHNRPRTGR
jgi:hypothetical protein